MLKTHSETVHLFNFLGTNNFHEYGDFSEWSAAIYKQWLQIDFDNIDHFDILKFVLTNVSRKYKPIMQEILLYHPDADYQEINNSGIQMGGDESHARRPVETELQRRRQKLPARPQTRPQSLEATALRSNATFAES